MDEIFILFVLTLAWVVGLAIAIVAGAGAGRFDWLGAGGIRFAVPLLLHFVGVPAVIYAASTFGGDSRAAGALFAVVPALLILGGLFVPGGAGRGMLMGGMSVYGMVILMTPWTAAAADMKAEQSTREVQANFLREEIERSVEAAKGIRGDATLEEVFSEFNPSQKREAAIAAGLEYLVANQPGFAQELIAGLEGSDESRYKAQMLLYSKAIPISEAVAKAIAAGIDADREELVVELPKRDASRPPDYPVSAACYRAHTLALRAEAHAALLMPAMERLSQFADQVQFAGEDQRNQGREVLREWVAAHRH